MRDCPFCGAEVAKDNYSRHLLKTHGDKSDEEWKSKGLEKPVDRAARKREERQQEFRRQRESAEARGKVAHAAAAVAVIIIVSAVGYLAYQNLYRGTGGGGGGGGGGSPAGTVAVMSTSMGTIKIRVYPDRAPTTAGNFINLVKSGFYSGVIFHRVVPGFVVQAGGFTSDGSPKSSPYGQIPWEGTGMANKKYTLSMARSGDANTQAGSGTATSQFFINLKDNPSLDAYTYPYVVFGEVIEGQSIIDAMGLIPTGSTPMADWPVNPPVINSAAMQ